MPEEVKNALKDFVKHLQSYYKKIGGTTSPVLVAYTLEQHLQDFIKKQEDNKNEG